MTGPTPTDFPREQLLELLRRARHMLVGAEQQRALLTDLRIPARAVYGDSSGAAPPVSDRSGGPAARQHAITSPVLRETRTSEPVETPATDHLPDQDYLPNQQPAPTSGTGDGESTPGGDIAEADHPAGPVMAMREFAETLLDVVATAEHLAAAVILARRAVSELPTDQRDGWSPLIATVEQLQVENARRALAEGGAPDLGTLTDWAGFECLHHYSLTDRFIGRAEHLTRLDDWIADPQGAAVVCLTALGGAGKSALAWHWSNQALTRLRQDGFRGVLWCSFYEGTFTFEDFIRRALAFCGRMDSAIVASLTRAEAETQLIAALTRARFLVVIDGLERLMTGYAQSSERAIDVEGTRGADDAGRATPMDRRMDHRRDGAFLARLAAPLASRVLITTRLTPAELEQDHDGDMRPHVERFDLPGLDRADAVALWNSILADSPVDEEIADILDACGFHPLVISILARSVAANGHGWAAWRGAERHRDFSPLGSVAQVRGHLIEMCLRDIGPEAEDVLNHLAVSGRPVRLEEIGEALREQSIANGEERWTDPGHVPRELAGLIDLGFVGEAVVDGRAEYDLHPVVRGLMWTRMTDPRGTPERHRYLDHAVSELTALPDPRLAAADVELQTVASIFQVLVSTGQSDRAWEMFRRLWAPLEYNGAYRELLDLFEQMLPDRDPLQLLPLRSRREQADAAYMLAHLMMGRGEAAVADCLMDWTGAIRLRIHDNLGFLEVCQSRTWQMLYQGELFDAELELRRVRLRAMRMGVDRQFATVDPWSGLALALRGELDQARPLLTLEQVDEEQRRWWVQTVAEGHLYLGDFARALELLDQLPADDDVQQHQLAWESLTRGMAQVGTGELDRAGENLQRALSIARRSAYRIVQCFALVSLGQIAIRQDRWSEAEDLVDQYFQVDDGGRLLTAGEAWLLRARCADHRGERDRAREYAATAYRVSSCDGPPFVYAAGVRHARELLDRLGGYLPRTSSRLPPTWREDLADLEADEAELRELRKHLEAGRTLVLIEKPESRERRLRISNLVHHAVEDDRRWWTLVAGTDRWLNRQLGAWMVDLDVTIADLRRLFEDSAEKSLEVVLFRLRSNRVLEPDPPTPFGGLDAEARDRWLSQVGEHEAALDVFLDSDRARDIERPFRYQGLDDRGVRAFSLDGRRRIRVADAPDEARRWWTGLEQRRNPWDMLILAECIQGVSATLGEFVDAISVTGSRGLEYGFWSLAEQQAIARLQVTELSRTDGWSDIDLHLRLQTVKFQLGWLDMDDPVRDFWTEIEKRHAQQTGLVLQLAEQLAIRGASITDYHRASLHSGNPGDPQATLAYLDYLRLTATQWAGDIWPDDFSVRRWSYDTASPTFRDVSSWTDEQVARLVDALRQRLHYASAPERARAWWDSLEATAAPATMIRLAEELAARSGTVNEFYRAHIDAASDNLLAVLSYFDFRVITKKEFGDDDEYLAASLLLAGNQSFADRKFAEATEAYEQAIAADGRYGVAYISLALSLDELGPDAAGERPQPIDVLRRGLENCPGHAELGLELRRVELGLPRDELADARLIAVELSEPLLGDVEGLLSRVEPARDQVFRAIGVRYPPLRFRPNDALEPGAYRILLDGVPVHTGRTVPGRVHVLMEGVDAEPVWPAARGVPEGDWREPSDGVASGGLTSHDHLIRDLRVELARMASRMLTEKAVLSLVGEGWSERPLDPVRDLALLAGFTHLLRDLLDDQVPILNADVLLDTYRAMVERGRPAREIVNRLRLVPAVRRRLPGNRGGDLLVPVDPPAEMPLQTATVDDASGVVLIAPTAVHSVLTWIRRAVRDRAADPRPAVLVVRSGDQRQILRLLVRSEFPDLPVVARDELLIGGGPR